MQATFDDLEQSDHICLDIRTEPLFVEHVEYDDDGNKCVFLVGKGTGEYKLTYDTEADVCRFFRKQSEDDDDWTSPRHVHGLEISRKNAPKGVLYI